MAVARGRQRLPLTRRRLFRVLAGAAALPVVSMCPGGGRAVAGGPLLRWQGVALGARSEIVFDGADRARAARVLDLCLDEMARLESIFSLFQPQSELARLNRAGRIEAPAHDLVHVLTEALRISALSAGAFDPTVQPLWQLYARHYAARPDGEGPAPQAIETAWALVDWRAVDIGAGRIGFARPGMALTLNGIAQGYITDRVVDLLRGEGFGAVLVDAGEIRALGGRADGGPWQVGLRDMGLPGDNGLLALPLADSALACSAGHGFVFGRRGQDHHLFDPATGASARSCRAVGVVAGRAMTADALSTALAVVAPSRRAQVASAGGAARVVICENDGMVIDLPARSVTGI